MCRGNWIHYSVFHSLLLLGISSVAVEIPLENVHGTTQQAKVRRVDNSFREENGQQKYAHPGGYDLEQIRRETHGMGASTVFLVRGTNIADAIKATRWVMTGGRSADVATLPDGDSKTDPLWAVVYMGVSGSSPPAWSLESATLENNTVRVTCRKGGAKTKDTHQYWYWIPLGVSDKGTYRIELTDAESHEILMVRRVEVK